jgi:hypothetical protein
MVAAEDAKVCCLAGRLGEFFQAWQGFLLQTGAAQHDLQGVDELVAEKVASGCLIVPDEVMYQECAEESVQRAGRKTRGPGKVGGSQAVRVVNESVQNVKRLVNGGWFYYTPHGGL